ncbi:MAG: hypothetical protein J7K63_02615 [Candidatus Marinimicrobia bacterium]|nr:hypothetical protein [Candidatus Neomarinimicrobiota bacterium]
MRAKLLKILLLGFLLFSVFGCEDVEDPNPPQRPFMVPKSLPWEYEESGIDADDKVAGIYLEWYRNPDPELEGYIIYRAPDTSETGELDYVAVDTVYTYSFNPALSDTEYVDTDIEFGTLYYYYIRALDVSENKSDPSDTVRYNLTPSPGNCEPNLSEKAPVKPEFSWKFPNDFQYSINYYYIRLENITTRQTVWFYGIPRFDYTGHGQSVTFNTDGKAAEPVLSPNYTYRWKVDAIGRQDPAGFEIEGSESPWITFQVKE